MIDYDKLKIAHEMAKKINQRVSVSVCYLVADDKPTFVLDHCDSKNNVTSYNFDDLITKLKELTQPEPKYIDGWVIDGFGNIEFWRNMTQEDIEKNSLKVYPSRESLIDAQINYWYDLKMETVKDSLSKCVPPFEGEVRGFSSLTDKESNRQITSCYHESSDEFYFLNMDKYMCIKCGEWIDE